MIRSSCTLRPTARRGRREPATAAALALLCLALLLAGCGDEEETNGEEQAVPVEAVEVKAATMRETVGATGTRLYRAEGTLLERRRVVVAGGLP